MASYLVTGGCGFIGSHLADALVLRGDRVRILDDLSTGLRTNAPSAAEVVIGDVADNAAVSAAMAGMDGCFHLAAIASVARSSEDWLGTHRVNLTATINVLDAARQGHRGPIAVVYASSAAVYGDSDQIPLSETGPTRPLTAYGADKLACELHARVGGVVHGVPTFGLRFFNIFGPRQDPRSPYSGVISIFAERLRQGLPLTIFGDGRQLRDFVYVGDVVAFLMRAMDRASTIGGIANVCTGQSTSILELAHALGQLLGIEPDIRFAPTRAGDIRRSLGCPKVAKASLGLVAEVELKDGLRATLTASPLAN